MTIMMVLLILSAAAVMMLLSVRTVFTQCMAQRAMFSQSSETLFNPGAQRGHEVSRMEERKEERKELAFISGGDSCWYNRVFIHFKDGGIYQEVADIKDLELIVEGEELVLKYLPLREGEVEYEERFDKRKVDYILIERCWECGGCSCDSEYSPDGIECGHDREIIRL